MLTMVKMFPAETADGKAPSVKVPEIIFKEISGHVASAFSVFDSPESERFLVIKTIPTQCNTQMWIYRREHLLQKHLQQSDLIGRSKPGLVL